MTPAGFAPDPKSNGITSPQRRRGRWILPLSVTVVVIAILGLFYYGLTSQRLQTGIAPRPNAPAPDFSLSTFDGKPIHLADLRGKSVILNFWASWCGPCADEQPVLNDVAKRYEAQGVVVVGVNVQDKQADALAFMARHGVAYPVVVDPNGAVYINYGVVAVPETYLITPDGAISQKFAQPVSSNTLVPAVEQLIRRGN